MINESTVCFDLLGCQPAVQMRLMPKICWSDSDTERLPMDMTENVEEENRLLRWPKQVKRLRSERRAGPHSNVLQSVWKGFMVLEGSCRCVLPRDASREFGNIKSPRLWILKAQHYFRAIVKCVCLYASQMELIVPKHLKALLFLLLF